MVGWNRRKLQILEYILETGEATSAEIADALDLEIHNTRTLLRRYNRQGLLSRYKVDAVGTRVYQITEKGVQRITWISDSFDIMDGEEEKGSKVRGHR